MNFIKTVQQALLNRCRGTQPITAEFTMAKIGDETNVYLEDGKTIVFRSSGKKTQIIVNGLSFFNKDNARKYIGLDKKAFRLLERS